MTVKMIASTEAQNNFGRVLDDVIQNGIRYVIRRRNNAQAIILSLADFEAILAKSDPQREEISRFLREITPNYSIGVSIQE